MSCFFIYPISLLSPFLYEAWKPIRLLPHSIIYSNKILSIFISLSFIFHSITPCLLSILQQLHILFCYFINKVIYGLLSSSHFFVYYFIIKVLKNIIPLVFQLYSWFVVTFACERCVYYFSVIRLNTYSMLIINI